MPQSLLITYGILLVSQLTIYGRAHRLVTQIIPGNDLRSNCVFELEGYGYNLCPLLEERTLVKAAGLPMEDDVDRGEGSSSGSRFYSVALGGIGGSDRFDKGNGFQGSECNEDTWVCLLDDEQSSKDRPIAGSIKANDKQNSRRRRKKYNLRSIASLEIGDGDTASTAPPLHLSLYGPVFQRERQVAKITFLCSDEESLRYVSEDKGVHSFSWATSHGCPVRLSNKASLHLVANEEPGNDSEGEGEGAEEKEKNEGDDDLLPSNRNRIRRWIAITVSVLVVFICIFVLLLSTRARSLATENLKGATYTIIPLLSQAVIKLRPLGRSLNNLTTKSIVRLGSRFRQGDSRLVQWAQEDMSLEDSEDVMVNGSGAFDRDELWNTEVSGEYIPLTFSPQYGHGRRTRSYGATPDVETFAERERGAMTGFAKLFGR